MILIKYIAQSGFCSRRKAEELIKNNLILINGSVQNSPTYEVKKEDIISCEDQVITLPELMYVMLYKPAGCITSKSDPSGRPTVMEYLPEKYTQLLDPVGRLDFHTSGLLLFTSDGSLAYKLSHPKHSVSKTYEVTVSRPLDLLLIETLRKGVKLENFFIRPDKVMWSPKRPFQLTLTIHTGQNRIIKRIMEQLNIFVKKLHRKEFAGLALGNLKPGEFRFLTSKEISDLKNKEESKDQRKPVSKPIKTPKKKS